MSEFCLFDLKNINTNISYDKLNEMAKTITRFCLDKDLAAFFNSYDYGVELINEVKMECFFLMSDSFLYKNCNFLDTTEFAYCNNEEQFKKGFLKKFDFFIDLLNIIFSYEITEIDIYLSEDGAVNCVEDFIVYKTTQKNFLKDLFNCIIKHVDEYARCFPTVKFEVTK